MAHKLILLVIISCFISCGKDEVVIEDVTIPIEDEEIYEVSVVGYAYDATSQEVLTDTEIRVGDKADVTDETGLYATKSHLIPKSGTVLSVDKAGYLPLRKRIHHHQSLETVVSSLDLLKLENLITTNMAEQSIDVDPNTTLILDGSEFGSIAQVTTYVPNQNLPFEMDNYAVGDNVEILSLEWMMYVGTNQALEDGKKLMIRLEESALQSDFDKLRLYRYSDSDDGWVASDQEFVQELVGYYLELDQPGWWTVSAATPAVYGSVQAIQSQAEAIANIEMTISNRESNHISNLYSSSTGKIKRYYPLDTEIEVNAAGTDLVSSSRFSIEERSVTAETTDVISILNQGKALSCDLVDFDGFVAFQRSGDDVIGIIDGGSFSNAGLLSTADMTIQFYDSEFNFLYGSDVNAEDLEDGLITYVACTKQLSIEKGSSLVTMADGCKIKVRPNESLIVSEINDDKVFLASFNGNIQGQYDGLLFSDAERKSLNGSQKTYTSMSKR